MRNPGLKLSLPSEMSDTFCEILNEYDIKHSVERKVSNGSSLVVNSAQESIKEIVITLINSAPFWAAFSACFIAYIKRTGKKNLIIEKNGKKIHLENLSHQELMKFFEDVRSMFCQDEDNKPSPNDMTNPDDRAPPDSR